MIASFRAYLLTLLAASILVSAIYALLPDGAIRKVLLFAGGIAVFLVAVRPLPLIDWDAVSRNLAIPALAPADYAAELEEANDELTQRYIKQQCEAYILDKAAQKGVALKSAYIILNGAQPVAATVSGTFTKLQREVMSELIEDALGIQTENQTWIWE